MKHLPLILFAAGAAMQIYDVTSKGSLFGATGSLNSINSKLPQMTVDGVTPTLGFYLMAVGAAWLAVQHFHGGGGE